MTNQDACKRCVALLLAMLLGALLGLAVLMAPSIAGAEGEKGETAYVRATHLILRKQAKEKGSAITQLDQNETVTILSYKDEWAYVAYKKHKGYVKGEYLSLTVTYAGGSAQAEGGTKNGASALRLNDQGEAVRELQRLLADAGYRVSADGVFGKGTEDALVAFQKSCGLAADGLAGTQTLDKLRAAGQAAASGAQTGSADSALREADAGDAVRELQRLLANAGYSVSTDGVFGERTEQAVIAFQIKMGLTADGLAGKQTLALLRSAPAAGASNSSAKVELLDWWKAGSGAFPVGTKATVVDVHTGIRFTVRRWGGVNHADVEPVTSDDTAKMKKAYGGAWSWVRRPIWVLTGGRVVAASMNGMPHMGYSNKSNEFPGHFCIHMKNSRTHGSNRVDEGHAAAVSEAYNSRDSFKQ